MPISKSLVQPFRKPMILIGSGFRGYFAPYLQGASPSPTIFDPTRQGRFDTNVPPAGWVDLGWIDQFRRSPAGRIGQIRSGYRGAVRAQYRGEIGSSVEFEFREWGKLQMALATGTSHFNVLKGAAGAAQQPLGGTPTAAVALGAGSTGTSIVLASGGGATFSVGQFVAVDVDYSGQAGYVGTGVQASYVQAGAVSDADFVRRVTFNVVGTVCGGYRGWRATVLLLSAAFGGQRARGFHLRSGKRRHRADSRARPARRIQRAGV